MSLKIVTLAAFLAVCCATPAPRLLNVITTETVLPIGELYSRYYNVYALQAPTGTYHGSKSILGDSVDVTMAIESSSALKFVISGPVSIDCDQEAYSFADNAFSFPNAGVSTDCLGQALNANSVKLSSVAYDPTSDSITVKVTYTIVSITIVLTHQSSEFVPAPVAHTVIPLPELVARYFAVFNLRDPTGTYTGSKSVLGQNVNSVVVVDAANLKFDFKISGPVSIDCAGETYQYASGSVVLPNINNDGDCIHDALKSNNVVLESFKYDASSDSFTFTVKYLFVNITLVLNHQA